MPFNIVYIDDEVELLELFKDTFESNEIIIKTFSDPVLALEYLNNHNPDLIFIDYRLPNINGDKLALKMKETIPKALITGDLSVTLQAKFEAKFDKPYNSIDIETFIEFIRKKA